MSTTTSQRERAQAGFSLIELMTVVAILGVLAVVAVAAYSKSVRNAHKGQIISDLSGISLKQKTFRAVAGHYASSTDCEGASCTYPTANQFQTVQGPIEWNPNDAAYTLAGQASSQYFRGGGDLHGWDALRFLPSTGSSWCGYGTVSGYGTDAPDANEADTPFTAPLASDVFPAASAPFYASDWFYTYALCDLDFDGQYWAFTAAHYEDEVNYSNDSTNTYRENE